MSDKFILTARQQYQRAKLDAQVREQLGLPPSEEPFPDVLFDQFEKTSHACGIYVPKNPERDNLLGFYLSAIPDTAFMPSPTFAWKFIGAVDQVIKPDSEEFEVNMVEALVGWRSWKVHSSKNVLISQYTHGQEEEPTSWQPGEALRAKCEHSHKVPAEFCECGIYARDTWQGLADYTGVYGQVYGWGRYVRGDQGWRQGPARAGRRSLLLRVRPYPGGQ